VTRLEVQPPDAGALEVARAAFAGLQRGAATGQWGDFVDLLADDVRIMIPVPSTEPGAPEGLLRGKATAEAMFGSHHEEQVRGARLEGHRVTANGPLVVVEARVEGNLGGEDVANHFVFVFEVADGRIASMYEYASWTAKSAESGWGDPAFAREAFGAPILPAEVVPA
jgi:ketosteroid isomerase-like protein